MTVNLKQHLANRRRLSWIPLFLLVVAILFIIGYGYWFPAPQVYNGYIRLEPESPRSQPYLSFHLLENNQERVYMVLINDLKFYQKVETFVNRRVIVKAFLRENEPADFNKIEILEIRETR